MVWYGMVWYGMVWYGMVWYGMVWYGMVVGHRLKAVAQSFPTNCCGRCGAVPDSKRLFEFLHHLLDNLRGYQRTEQRVVGWGGEGVSKRYTSDTHSINCNESLS